MPNLYNEHAITTMLTLFESWQSNRLIMFLIFFIYNKYNEVFDYIRMGTNDFLETFLNSLKLPNKQAMFQLNRTGMDITVVYLFTLLLIVSMPSLFEMITATSGPTADMNLLFLLIYFFMFYYLPLDRKSVV